MREGMNLFHTFSVYFWRKRFFPNCKTQNPFKYLLGVCKCWGFKCFAKDQFYKPSYIAGFKFLKDILLNKRTVW